LGDGDKILKLEAYHPSATFPDKIDWQAFSCGASTRPSSCSIPRRIIADPTPLRTLAIRTRLHHTQRTVPQPVQRTPLSALQKLVKDARKIIVDPVLESIYRTAHSDSTLDPTFTSNDTNDPEPPTTILPTPLSEDKSETRTPSMQESTRTRELKKRKVRPDLAVGCKFGEGSDSMFMHHDDDESTELDASTGITLTLHSTLPTPVDGTSVQGEEDADSSCATPIHQSGQHSEHGLGRAGPAPAYPTDLSVRSSRIRKPSLKLQPQGLVELKDPSSALPSPSSLGKRSRESSEVKSATRKPKTEPLSSSADANTEMNKSRSDTYKQVWSVSEQHLLERLLDEIPDGERNRYVFRLARLVTLFTVPVQLGKDIAGYGRTEDTETGSESGSEVF